MKKSVFALFFTTQGRSLENWERIGIFEREVKLYRHTAAHFTTIYFFTYGTRDVAYRDRLPDNIVIVPKPKYLPVMLYSFLLPLIHWRKLKGVDIYKTNQMDGSWTAVLAKKLYGGKLIVRCGYEWLRFMQLANRSWLKRFAARTAETFAYRNADVIVQTSQEAGQFVQKEFSIAAEKVHIIPNYIDTNLFVPTAEAKQQNSIVYVGRLEPEKNVLSLIEALDGLPVTLTIIGNGSQRALLERTAQARMVSIQWLGIVSQTALPAALTKHAVFVLPSLHEGSPKTLLEAMSCGLPCIATDVPGSREVVHTGIDGILSGTAPQSLRVSIQRLLEDADLRTRLGAAARITILNTYSFEKILEQELSVYTTLL